MTEFTIDVPVQLVSEANDRSHWSARHRRRKAQRQAVAVAWKVAGVKVPAFDHVHVLLTRLCPARSRSRDGDNLQASAKAVRDEVAKLLGIDDSDLSKESIATWAYLQHVNQRHLVKVQMTFTKDQP